MAEEAVDLSKVVEGFSLSLDGDHVIMDRYMDAYDELYRFLCYMGSVFGFVASDVKSKLGILRRHRSSENGSHYKTVRSMVDYEVQNDLLSKRHCELPNGCRTLLRLHRALLFLSELFGGIKTSQNHDKMSDIAHKAYSSTLAKYHTWMIRKGVGMAVYALPSREQFLHRMNATSEEAVQKLLTQLVDSSQCVYNRVQEIYEAHNLLHLP